MRRTLGRIPVLVVLAAAAAGATSCATARGGADPPPPALQRSQLSLIYDRMLRAISRPGEVYHPTITTVMFQDPFTVTTTSELWIDPATRRARVAVRTVFGDIGEKTSTWIIDGDRWYETQEDGSVRKREAVRCRDAESVLLSLLLGCRDATESAITAPIDASAFEGTPVAALYTQGAVHTPSEEAVFIDTLYLHARTYLPIALQRSGVLRPTAAALDGRHAETQIGQATRYAHAFVPVDSLPPGFFDPESIGFVEEDPAATLREPSPDLTYYWLGRNLAPDGLPSLALDAAYLAEAAARPQLRFRAVIKYRGDGDEFGGTLLELQEWRADEWDTLLASGAAPAGTLLCETTTDVDLGDRGEAILYAGRAPSLEGDGCSSPPNAFVVVARTGSTVVRISAPNGGDWNSEAGMRAALDALAPVDAPPDTN